MADRAGAAAAVAVLAFVVVSAAHPARADSPVTPWEVPPTLAPGQADPAAAALANPLNRPITGAKDLPTIVGGERPPSLEALQALRPGDQPGDGLEAGRSDVLRDAGRIYGAQGGLAARAFALNEMLRRNEPQLDSAYDFRPLVLPAGSGQTLMKPPIVTAAQMAFALGDGGQVARESSCIYQITRAAELTSAPPNWRSYLVRAWDTPPRPADAVLPRTKGEVAYWNKFVAEGWAQGEKQAVEIFLNDLGRLQRDIIGMARYRVLLRARLVEQPTVAFQNQAVQGGGDQMRVGDRTIRITDQPGLQANPRRWTPGAGCPQ
jgi:defect-in-organelle-trafficking protein DotC